MPRPWTGMGPCDGAAGWADASVQIDMSLESLCRWYMNGWLY